MEIEICEARAVVQTFTVDGTVSLGRQGEGEKPPPAMTKLPSGVTRIVLAGEQEMTVSREHARIEDRSDGKIWIKNESKKISILFEDGTQPLLPGQHREVWMPISISLGSKLVRLRAAGSSTSLRTLNAHTLAPGHFAASGETMAPPALGFGVDSVAFFGWLQTTMGVLQSAAGAPDYLQRAVRALVDVIQLDSGRVLYYKDGAWERQACYPDKGEPLRKESTAVLAVISKEKRTVYEPPSTYSMAGIRAVVAAPILDHQGKVLGALYGERLTGSERALTHREAVLVEVLAGAVAAGMARVAQEEKAQAQRQRFEQFFTEDLARELLADEARLNPRKPTVTVLFCDIRGFSTISEQLPPERTVAFVRDVLERMTACALRHQGVVIDYIGDELMVMWGAPDERQTDHAARACAAGLEMLGTLVELNRVWERELGGPMAVHVGINTGPAHVGAIGTQRKYKYGPLGTTVNLASRVQGATRFLEVPMIATAATRQGLLDDRNLRKLCRVRVKNIVEPVELWEVAEANRVGWADLAGRYKEALDLFERKGLTNLRGACRQLGEILHTHPNDGPTLVLLSRAVNYLAARNETYDPVWELPGK